MAKDISKVIEIFAPVAEITSDPAGIVKLDEELVRTVVDDDTDPKFAIVCIEEGKSKNEIYYGADILASVSEQINRNQPVGYLGHLHTTKEGKENLLPDPQVIWLGATTVTENNKTKLYAKGYLFPESKIRGWIKRKAVNSVSWVGDAVLTPLVGGGYKAKELMLESLDFSRKGSQGMSAGVLAVVSEMEREGGTNVTSEEIAALQLGEVEAHNPGLIQTIKEMQKKEDEAVKDTAVSAAVAEKDAELAEKLKEVPEVDEVQKLREHFNIDDKKSVFDALVELSEKFSGLSKKMLQSAIDKMLEEKVPNERARKLVHRLVTVSEMRRSDLDFINESDKIEEEIGAAVDEALENDEDIKAVITEMASDRGGLHLNNNGSGKKKKSTDAEFEGNDNLEVIEESVG